MEQPQQPSQQPPPTEPETTPIIFNESPVAGSNKQDRRSSDEWDASKVPPSRFQRRKGSIYATPSSRDGHVDKNFADKYHAKLAQMKTGFWWGGESAGGKKSGGAKSPPPS